MRQEPSEKSSPQEKQPLTLWDKSPLRRALHRRNTGKPSKQGSDPDRERERTEETHLTTELQNKGLRPRPSRRTRREGQSPTWGGTEHDTDAIKEDRSRRKKTTRSKIQLGLREGKGEMDRNHLQEPPDDEKEKGPLPQPEAKGLRLRRTSPISVERVDKRGIENLRPTGPGLQEDVHSKQRGQARVDNKACRSEAQEEAGKGDNKVTSCYWKQDSWKRSLGFINKKRSCLEIRKKAGYLLRNSGRQKEPKREDCHLISSSIWENNAQRKKKKKKNQDLTDDSRKGMKSRRGPVPSLVDKKWSNNLFLIQETAIEKV